MHDVSSRSLWLPLVAGRFSCARGLRFHFLNHVATYCNEAGIIATVVIVLDMICSKHVSKQSRAPIEKGEELAHKSHRKVHRPTA